MSIDLAFIRSSNINPVFVYSTIAYDDLKDPGDDPRWEIFLKFHEYLQQRFPLACVSRHPRDSFKLIYLLQSQGVEEEQSE